MCFLDSLFGSIVFPLIRFVPVEFATANVVALVKLEQDHVSVSSFASHENEETVTDQTVRIHGDTHIK